MHFLRGNLLAPLFAQAEFLIDQPEHRIIASSSGRIELLYLGRPWPAARPGLFGQSLLVCGLD